MLALLEKVGYEPFLILWVSIAPVASAALATWWSGKQQREQRAHETARWEKQNELDKEQRAEEQERRESYALHSRMEEAYRRYLDGSSRITALQNPSQTSEQARAAFNELSGGFQQLLLVASVESAKPAIGIWKETLNLISSDNDSDQSRNVKNIKELRAEFVREARRDLSNPVERNSNPGFKIEPALQVGGFTLNDVG